VHIFPFFTLSDLLVPVQNTAALLHKCGDLINMLNELQLNTHK